MSDAICRVGGYSGLQHELKNGEHIICNETSGEPLPITYVPWIKVEKKRRKGVRPNKYAFFWVHTSSDLYVVQLSGQINRVARFQRQSITDIAYQQNGDFLTVVNNSPFIYKINKDTGRTITTYGIGSPNLFNFGPALCFAFGKLYASRAGQTGLYEIDYLNGTHTLVADMGFEARGDMCEIDGFILWAGNTQNDNRTNLVRYNPIDNSVLEIGVIQSSVWDNYHIFGLGSLDKKILYGVGYLGGLAASNPKYLFRINTSTAVMEEATLIAPEVSNNIFGMTFVE